MGRTFDMNLSLEGLTGSASMPQEGKSCASVYQGRSWNVAFPVEGSVKTEAVAQKTMLASSRKSGDEVFPHSTKKLPSANSALRALVFG